MLNSFCALRLELIKHRGSARVSLGYYHLLFYSSKHAKVTNSAKAENCDEYSHIAISVIDILGKSEFMSAYIDRAVMEAYGFWGKLNTESECVAQLMKMYQKLVDNIEKK